MLTGVVSNSIYLNGGVQGYFHDWYYSMDDERNAHIKFINFLKNDFLTFTSLVPSSERKLTQVLVEDLREIVAVHGQLTVCGIPRSKREGTYPASKMGLKRGIRAAVVQVAGLEDGLDYIVRYKDTCTTHWARYNRGGEGPMPYPGITWDTCRISTEVAGKDVLLIDDIYTPNCGIDEDAIQTLLDAGANSVIFYAIGYTARKSCRNCA